MQLELTFEKSDLSKLDLIPKQEYRSELSKYLSVECFKPDTKHLINYLICVAVCLFGIYSIITIDFLPVKILISVINGIALTSLTFFLHDLFHGSIVKSNPFAYLLGLSVGLFNLFSPTFWHRVHNLHHARTGNTDDPDRSYISLEKPQNALEKFVYKTRISDESYHPFISLILMTSGFFWYFSNGMYYGLVGKKTCLKEDKKYKRIQELFKKDSDKLLVLAELFIILGFQAFLFFLIAKANFLNYFLISLLPVAISHLITMLYIHTNHFLSPLTGEVDDPLINSLSVENIPLVDKIFLNFSHHVEHHLFPAMGSSHYPKVRKLLLKMYPNRFQLIPMKEAIKLLFKTPRIYGDYIHLVSTSGKKVKCLMPSKP